MALPVVNPAQQLPVPQAIETLDYETLFQAWLDKFIELTDGEYDVGGQETDPGVIIAQAMSYMRMLDRGRVNDAYMALRLALSWGENLDGLAADRGVKRLVYDPGDPDNDIDPIVEDDESLRLRSWLRMQAWNAGNPLSVEYWARSRGLPKIADAHCIDYPGEGRMKLVLLPPVSTAETPEEIADEQEAWNVVLADVGAYVMARERRPGAVWIDTVEATKVTVNIAATLCVRRGASAASVKASAESSLRKFMAARRRIGAIVPVSAIYSALHVASVVRVREESLLPADDVVLQPHQASEIGTVTLTTEIVDD